MAPLISLPVEPLAQALGLPWLQVWADDGPASAPADGVMQPLSDFWHVGDFSPGTGGQTELLRVNYRDNSLRLQALEVHWRTEQAVVPLLNTALLQVVCPSRVDDARLPDTRALRCFEIKPGEGLNMLPGCWHASFVRDAECRCRMLTRRSTTLDLVAHLRHGQPATESSHVWLTGPGQAGWVVQA